MNTRSPDPLPSPSLPQSLHDPVTGPPLADPASGGVHRRVFSRMPEIGLYPMLRAARLAQVSDPIARRWVGRQRYWYRGMQYRFRAVIGPERLPVARKRNLTFHEMLTLRIVKGLGSVGLSVATIRRVALASAVAFGSKTPLVTRAFRDEGAALVLAFDHAEPDVASEHTPSEIAAWRRVFADVVEASLFRDVDWDGDVVARWWPMGHDRSVVIDPWLEAGAPLIAETTIATETIAAALGKARGDEAVAAEGLGVSIEQLRDAVRFETAWLKPV